MTITRGNQLHGCSQLAELISEGYGFLNDRGWLIHCNSLLADSLGYSIEEMMGRPFNHFLAESSRDLFSERLSEEGSIEGESLNLVILSKVGREIPSDVTLGFLEEEESKGFFIVVKNVQPTPSESDQILHQIAEQLRSTVMTVDREGIIHLLEVPLTKTYLCLSLKESVKTFTEQQKDIVVDLDCPLVNAAIDADRFLSVLLMNLLDNTVTHSAGPGCHVWVKLEDAGDAYEISIADDGPGISDSVKKTLFDPNRRFGGVGIHQASQIARKYGGSIEVGNRVPSDSSQGAKFLIRLPKAETANRYNGSYETAVS